MLPREAVLVRLAPRIERNRLFQIRAAPLRFVLGARDKHRESLFGGRVVTHIEAVVIERLAERVDLRLCRAHFGLAQLREVTRRDVACQEADDYHYHQQLEQRKTATAPPRVKLLVPHCSS